MHDLLNANCVVGLLCVVSLSGCSLLVKTHERQCKKDADCVAANLGSLCVDEVCSEPDECEGPACTMANAAVNESCVSSEIAEHWHCAGDDQTIKSSSVRFAFHIVDFLSRKPPKQIVVNACRTNDVACADPAGTFIDTDGTGHAQFDLPSGFFGFFEVHSEALTTLLYVAKPIVKNTSDRDLPVLSAQAVQLTAGVTGITIDPTKGLAILEALDCSETPAGGVQFNASAETSDQFYLVDQVPSREATVTAYDELNNSANGGFANLAPGFVTFRARLGVDGLELGLFNAQIRANTVTFIDMHF
jgi:hypothetical protein